MSRSTTSLTPVPAQLSAAPALPEPLSFCFFCLPPFFFPPRSSSSSSASSAATPRARSCAYCARTTRMQSSTTLTGHTARQCARHMSTTASGCAKFWSPAVTALSRLLGTSAGERLAGRSTTCRRRTRSGASSVGIIIHAPVSRCSASASARHLRPPPLRSLRTDSTSGRYVGNASSPRTGSDSTCLGRRTTQI
eukprot:3113094-Rhodomonas_salina.1